MVAARELTKLHEEIWRGAISEALDYFEERHPRGEFTLVIDGAPVADSVCIWPEEEVRQAMAECRQRGLSTKEAAREVAGLAGWSRRDVYRLGLNGNDSVSQAKNAP